MRGFADSEFRTDPTVGKSQTSYIFLQCGAPISWKSKKQTVTATATNHVELLAFHEAVWKCIWLRTIERIINQQCPIQEEETKAKTIFEDNAACVRQMSSEFIKADRTKYISPHIFSFTQDLIDKCQIDIQKAESENNVADMLTKALPTCKLRKLVYATGMRTLQEITSSDCQHCFLYQDFVPNQGLFDKVFNEVNNRLRRNVKDINYNLQLNLQAKQLINIPVWRYIP